MAKLKADWFKEAQDLGLDVTSKNTVDEIKAAIEGADSPEVTKTESKETPEAEESFTKAGRRSKKGQEEAEEKAEKIARQQGELDEAEVSDDDEEEVKKGPAPKVRPRIERRSKRYQTAAEQVDKTKTYELPAAVELAQATSTVKFDASVELHVKLNVEPKKADQNIRGSIVLPHGTGRSVNIAVLADEDDMKKAKTAGADLTNADTLMKQLEDQSEEFDVLVAQPQMMSKLGKYAKYLGPKGLMPNPKSGTVTQDVAKAVTELKAGRVEYRVDRYGIVHVGIGKVSFKKSQIEDNVRALVKALRDARPNSIKNEYMDSMVISTSMGPSIKISVERKN